MEHGYTEAKNIEILIALLKAHKIRKVIASPGTSNLTLIGSIQYDSWFEIYSCVDERSAAYMACGLAAESGEPVCLSCTGATASRNYVPGLTEAYYRKLPVLALTSSQPIGRIGSLSPQMLDRTNPMNDIANYFCTIPYCNTDEEVWECQIKINTALLALKRHGGGPVIINVQQLGSLNFSITQLPDVNVINRFTMNDSLPPLPQGKIAIWVGNHKKMNAELTESIDLFCENNNALVFTDCTSGYHGKYGLNYAIVDSQLLNTKEQPDLMIHIGEVSGAYYGTPKNVWRVNEDGEIRDLFHKLRNVFEMNEEYFFRQYIKNNRKKDSCSYYEKCKEHLLAVRSKIPELPFSNIWCAQYTADKIPDGSAVFLGILNSLRSYNFFDLPQGVDGFSNTGGFGIDGGVSSAVGSSLSDRKRLHFCITGDLSFFYDMNSIGNHNVSSNLRILMINNGKGTEFRNFNHPGAAFGDDADLFIAAGGHFGNKSSTLVKHYAQDLGFEYFTASNKTEYIEKITRFLEPNITNKPMLFEVFTSDVDESAALKTVLNIDTDTSGEIKSAARKILGAKGVKMVKKILGKNQ